MKKHITLILFLVTVSLNCPAQNFLGSTYDQIREEYHQNPDNYHNWNFRKATNEEPAKASMFSRKVVGMNYIYEFANGINKPATSYIILTPFNREIVRSWLSDLNSTADQTRAYHWVDKKRSCTWDLKVIDTKFMILRADKL